MLQIKIQMLPFEMEGGKKRLYLEELLVYHSLQESQQVASTRCSFGHWRVIHWRTTVTHDVTHLPLVPSLRRPFVSRDIKYFLWEQFPEHTD